MTRSTILAEINKALKAENPMGAVTGADALYDLFQGAVESATGGDGLSDYVPMSDETAGRAIEKHADALVVGAAIAYAGREIAEAICALTAALESTAESA